MQSQPITLFCSLISTHFCVFQLQMLQLANRLEAERNCREQHGIIFVIFADRRRQHGLAAAFVDRERADAIAEAELAAQNFRKRGPKRQRR